jgi:hypothetical protein
MCTSDTLVQDDASIQYFVVLFVREKVICCMPLTKEIGRCETPNANGKMFNMICDVMNIRIRNALTLCSFIIVSPLFSSWNSSSGVQHYCMTWVSLMSIFKQIDI